MPALFTIISIKNLRTWCNRVKEFRAVEIAIKELNTKICRIMDFQERFKGRMTVVKKEGIDSLISTGGIPVKTSNSPFKGRNNLSFQAAANFGDEVDLSYNFPNHRFYSNVIPSPRPEVSRLGYLNSSALEDTFPERPIESASPVFNRALGHKKIVMTPLDNRSNSNMESQNSFRYSTHNQQNFSILAQKRKIPTALGRQHSRSVICDRRDYDTTSFSLNASPKSGETQATMRKSSLAKDNLSYSSVIKVKEVEKNTSPELPLRKLNSLDSRRISPEKVRVQKEMLNKIAMTNTNNMSILLERQNSNSRLYNKIQKTKLQRISDNQFRFEKMAAVFNQEGAAYNLKPDQGNPIKEFRSVNDDRSREVTTFKRERNFYSKTLVLPKIN